MEPFEASLFRETDDRPDFRIDIFELVIHLSKEKQSAFRFFSHFSRSPLILRSLVKPCGMQFFYWKAVLNNHKPFVSLQLQLVKYNMTCATEGNRHVLFLQVWSLWFLVRPNILCT